MPLIRASGFAWAGAIATEFVGELYWLAGEREKAMRYLRESLGVSERSGMRYCTGRAYRLLGEVALDSEPSQAVEHFVKSMAICQEIQAENELALAYAGYGRLLQRQGRTAEAREHLTRALEILERLGTQREPDKVREVLARLA